MMKLFAVAHRHLLAAVAASALVAVAARAHAKDAPEPGCLTDQALCSAIAADVRCINECVSREGTGCTCWGADFDGDDVVEPCEISLAKEAVEMSNAGNGLACCATVCDELVARDAGVRDAGNGDAHDAAFSTADAGSHDANEPGDAQADGPGIDPIVPDSAAGNDAEPVDGGPEEATDASLNAPAVLPPPSGLAFGGGGGIGCAVAAPRGPNRDWVRGYLAALAATLGHLLWRRSRGRNGSSPSRSNPG